MHVRVRPMKCSLLQGVFAIVLGIYILIAYAYVTRQVPQILDHADDKLDPITGVMVVMVLLGLGFVLVASLVAEARRFSAKVDFKSRYRQWDRNRNVVQDVGECRAWLAEGAELLDLGEKVRRRTIGSERMEIDLMVMEIRSDMRTYGAANLVASAVEVSESESDMIKELARLRGEGQISAEEFEAFTERFRVSTGAKAREIIAAIEQLHAQRRAGAMTEGNYHASLWTLMDRLDTETARP